VQQLQIENCHRDEIDLLTLALEATTALSVTFTDKHDCPILEPELGTTPLWPNVVVQALFEEKEDAKDAAMRLLAGYPHLSYSIETLPEQDWERVCMQDFKPQRFGERLWICPTWLTPPEPDAVNLILDPGLAFGTGTHPTTFLCLTWLEQAALENLRVIDYGCGSGILALAALKLGALHVDAVDIDQQALTATKSNAIDNHISDSRLTVNFPEALTAPADLLIANILLTPLVNLESRFYELLHNEGTLVVSGLLKEQAQELIDAYRTHFTLASSTYHDGWALLVFKALKAI